MVICMINSRKYYEKLVKDKIEPKKVLRNFLQAFLFGGFLSVFGQVIFNILLGYFESSMSSLILSLIIITLAAVLTAAGIYDNIGQIAKCGIAIPISGFANSCVSSAMEYKKEGIVLGIGSNCLKLAGSVIVLGSFAATILNIIRFFIEVLK